jgi:hypothetical protein
MGISWYPFTDPHVGDCVGWTAADLMPPGGVWTKTVTVRDGDTIRYFDTKHHVVMTCVLVTWRRWCNNNQPRCISTNHLKSI